MRVSIGTKRRKRKQGRGDTEEWRGKRKGGRGRRLMGK